MDAKQTLLDAQVALVEDDFVGCRDLLAAYAEWRAKGGFEPLMHNGQLVGPQYGDAVAKEIRSFLP